MSPHSSGRGVILFRVKSFHITISINKILTGFKQCILKGTFPLYKHQPLFD